ncbi:phospholipase-like protein [Tanacetum coccineum]
MLANSRNVKTRDISRVLRIILVILPEHQSDTKVFTMTMEILLEPTSNKLYGRFLDGGSSYPGKRDIVVGRRFWLSLACLDIAKTGWLTDHTTRGRLGYDVEKVYFPVNEPIKHWYLAELEICNGVVTFYDSLGWASGNRRRWWRQMKKLLPEKLTIYLVMHGILKSKGISAESYNITYKYAVVPF